MHPRTDRTAVTRAVPAELTPHYRHWPAERGEIDQPPSHRLLDPVGRPEVRARRPATVEAMWTCIGAVHGMTPTTSKSARPTRARQMDLDLRCIGIPRVGGVRHLHSCGVPVPVEAPSAAHRPVTPPYQLPKCRILPDERDMEANPGHHPPDSPN